MNSESAHDLDSMESSGEIFVDENFNKETTEVTSKLQVLPVSEDNNKNEEDDFVEENPKMEEEVNQTNEPCSSSPIGQSRCCNNCNSGSSNNSSGFDLNNIMDMAKLLLPLLSGGSGSSGLSNLFGGSSKKESCQEKELIELFHGMWDGLDKITNKQIRSICFMDRLNKFHSQVWNYAREHSKSASSGSKNTITETAFDLIEEKIQVEISNVMEQLSK